jgi:hypothetical protein
MKIFASSIDLHGSLSIFVYAVVERSANISLSSPISSCLNVSLSVFKIGKGLKMLAVILKD